MEVQSGKINTIDSLSKAKLGFLGQGTHNTRVPRHL